MAIDLTQWNIGGGSRARRLRHVERRPGIGRLAADVQEQRTNRVEHVARGSGSTVRSTRYLLRGNVVGVRRDAQIAWR